MSASRIPPKAVVERWINTAGKRIAMLLSAAYVLNSLLETAAALYNAALEVYKLWTEELPRMVREALSEALDMPWSMDEAVSIGVLTEKVSERTGIVFRDLSNAQMVKEDLQQYALDEFNAATGLQIESLEEPDALKQALIDAAVQGVISGGNRFISSKKAGRIAIGVWEKSCEVRDGRALSLLPMSIGHLYRRNKHREHQRIFEKNHLRKHY